MLMQETSRAAYRAAQRSAVTDRETIFQYLLERGYYGATDFEIGAATGIPPNTARPRRNELVATQRVFKTALRRPAPSGHPAIVWSLVPDPEPAFA